ncbi:MAG TPA: GNAT family N-acetyltransferase [Nocardioidaceae bacterium]|nr:GNAT family N-acetyltransferase [Nocardioidaceae bacterium]
MSTSGVLVRAATRDDLGTVARIYRHYVDSTVATFENTPPDRGEWARRYAESADHRLPFLVAEARELIVGYAYATRWRSRAAYQHTVEESVYVVPWAVGKGVGAALLDELLRSCQLANVREVVAVIVDSGDLASAELHRRRGFVEAGRLTRVGHKHDRWLDTVLMQRSLVEPPASIAG